MGKKIVYVFPPGFRKEAEATYGWMRHYGLTPSWGGDLAIELPENEVDALRMLARVNPARFGNESEIERRVAGDLSIGAPEVVFATCDTVLAEFMDPTGSLRKAGLLKVVGGLKP